MSSTEKEIFIFYVIKSDAKKKDPLFRRNYCKKVA